MQQHQNEYPRMLTSQNEKYGVLKEIYKEPKYLYNTFGWCILVFNLIMAWPVIKKTWEEGYDGSYHIIMLIAFCASYAAVAATRKYIIERDFDV